MVIYKIKKVEGLSRVSLWSNLRCFASLSSKRLLVFSLLLTLASWGLVGSGFAMQIASAEGISSYDENVEFNDINKTRAAAGVAKVQSSPCLTNLARYWAKDMSIHGFRHSFSQNLIQPFCGSGWSWLAENIGLNYCSGTPTSDNCSQVMYNAFLASAPHHANIIDSKSNLLGVGAYRDASNKLWVVQEFAGCVGCGSPWTGSTPPPATVPGWSDWENQGGILTSGPAVSSQGSGRLDVFARGTDNALWHKSLQNNSWSVWDSQGGILTSDPAAVSWGSGRIDVFARGTDNALWHKSFQNNVWSTWENLGGCLGSGPGVSSWGSGRLDVFIKGCNNALLHKSFQNNSWSSWDNQGGTLTSDPAAVSWGSGRIDIFARGTDNALWHKWYDNGWHAWQSLGGYLTSGPGVSSWGSGRLDVFVAGGDHALYHKWYSGSWSNWEYQGGYLSSDPDAVSWGPGRVDVMVRGGNVLYHKWYN